MSKERYLIRYSGVDVYLDLRKDLTAGLAIYAVQGKTKIRLTDWIANTDENLVKYQTLLGAIYTLLQGNNTYRPTLSGAG